MLACALTILAETGFSFKVPSDFGVSMHVSRTSSRLSALLFTGLAFVWTDGLGHAASNPAARCTAAIQRAAGKHAKCLLHADAKLAVSGDFDRYNKKVAGCEKAFERRHDRALIRYSVDNCPTDSADDFQDSVFQSTAQITAAAANTIGGTTVARLGPMTESVKGVNYEPAPSDYTLPPQSIYFDTDFYNQDFVQLWGTGTPPDQPGGRNDVGDMQSLGVNFVRVFNWDAGGTVDQPFRNHQPWLNSLADAKIYTAGVFSNGNRKTAQAQMVVDQFNSFSSGAKDQIAVWLIGNEISPTDPLTPQTLQVIKNSAKPPLDTIPICVPFQMSGTQDAIEKVKTNYQQQFMPSGLESRFIACFNFYGLGKPVSTQSPEDQVTEFITGFFADPFIQTNNIALLFTEFGINFDGSSGLEPNAGGNANMQGQYLNEMLAQSIALQARYPRLLGQAVFEYTNESWKTPLTEANFGLYSLMNQAPPLTGKTTRASDPPYPVDTRVIRPQHEAVVDNY